MTLWRITPSARPDDSRWEDHPVFAQVIVRAETASLARLIAGKTLFRDNTKIQFGEERDTIFISAFDDEKLYRVIELAPPFAYPKAGPRVVLFSKEIAIDDRILLVK
jgi:glycerophosphoryl diester phosphodiesterase